VAADAKAAAFSINQLITGLFTAERGSVLDCRTKFSACANFNVVMRKLISELQACPQCIQESSMPRFCSPIDLDDVILIMQAMSRDLVFHATLHPSPWSLQA